MKNILIMRHAKSDWNTSGSDFDRPLNKRGKEAAPQMGKYLVSKKVMPQIIIASPANRAKETAEFVKSALNFTNEIKWNSDFYYGNEMSMIDDLFSLPDEVDTALLIGHNPTVENVVAKLSSEYSVMVTATVVSVNAAIKKWTDLKLYENKLDWAMSPKNIK